MASQTMMNGLKGIAAFAAIAGGGVMLLKLQYDSSPAGQAVAAKLEQQENDRPLINVAETLVKGRLRDPDSATFTGTKVVRSSGKEAVCGFVNARNGAGGMTGDRWFIVADSEAYFMDDGADAAQVIEATCGTTST